MKELKLEDITYIAAAVSATSFGLSSVYTFSFIIFYDSFFLRFIELNDILNSFTFISVVLVIILFIITFQISYLVRIRGKQSLPWFLSSTLSGIVVCWIVAQYFGVETLHIISVLGMSLWLIIMSMIAHSHNWSIWQKIFLIALPVALFVAIDFSRTQATALKEATNGRPTKIMLADGKLIEQKRFVYNLEKGILVRDMNTAENTLIPWEQIHSFSVAKKK